MHTYKHWRTPLLSLNAFLSALEQTVRQATGKIILFCLLGKSFEKCYIINIWLEDVTLFLLFFLSMSTVIFDIQYALYTVYTTNTVYAVHPICSFCQTTGTSLYTCHCHACPLVIIQVYWSWAVNTNLTNKLQSSQRNQPLALTHFREQIKYFFYSYLIFCSLHIANMTTWW